MDTRKRGILMPVSSLPSAEGIGTLGAGAFSFIDFLKSSGMTVWQVLPLNPTNYGDSPYQSCCANALNYYFIDVELLREEGLLTGEEIQAADLCPDAGRVDYGVQFTRKVALLKKAFARFDRSEPSFTALVESGKYSDFALFMSLKGKFGHRAWEEWEEPYRTYSDDAAQKYAAENADDILFWQFTQHIFIKQWQALKAYAASSGIEIMGDIPLYLAYDSVEMWKYGDKLFQVDARRRPECVAGVPPDAFTDEGQLWGNPLYDWEKMKGDGYKWWSDRIDDCLNFFDILRIDHFRGFDRCYAVPYGSPDARKGEWRDGPKEELFKDKLDYKIVAEDLGVIDDGVIRLLNESGFPSMKVLMFAFDGEKDNGYLPQNIGEHSVAYTGTHDNDTALGFLLKQTDKEFAAFKKGLRSALGYEGVYTPVVDRADAVRGLVLCALNTRSAIAVVPVQDILCLDNASRMNTPSTPQGNWGFRLTAMPSRSAMAQFKNAVIRAGRA